MDTYNKSQVEKMKELTRQKGQEAIPTGKVHTKEYKSYYDVNNTITTALATNPNNPEHSSYNVEPIFQSSQRNAEKIFVSNDGNDTLFVIVSHGGVEHSTRERPVYPGDVKTYYNVFELRLRSPTAGIPYRVTEYEIERSGSGTAGAGIANRSSFTARSLQNIGLAGVATQLPSIAIPDGFALVIRATVGNGGQVYLATTAANTGVATTRNTLNAGDVTKLFITNANLVFVAGSAINQNVDIIVEQ